MTLVRQSTHAISPCSPTTAGPPPRCPNPGSPATHANTHTLQPLLPSQCLYWSLEAAWGHQDSDWVLWGASWGCWCVTPPGARALGTTCHHLARQVGASQGGGSECLIDSPLHPGSHWQRDEPSPRQNSSCSHPIPVPLHPASINSVRNCLFGH